MKGHAVSRKPGARHSALLPLLGVGAAVLFSVAVAGTPQLRGNTQAMRGTASSLPLGPLCGTVTISQSSAQTITPTNSVSCNNGSSHTDNSYFRAFDLASLGAPGGLDVCQVRVGVEYAATSGGSQPVTVNLYTSESLFPGGFPGSLTVIGSATAEVADSASGTIVDIPVTGSAPADSQLVVEVFTPNGAASGNLFFIGSNADPQSGPSYLRAGDCAITAPTETSAIGFPDMHIVLEAVGNPPPPPACGTITLTQSSTQTITSGNSVSCNRGSSHATNSYFRAFDLASLGAPDGIDVCEVQFGVDVAQTADEDQPVFVTLYTSDTPFPSGYPGSLHMIGFYPGFVFNSDSGSVVSYPITGSAPAGSQLVVEVNTPDGVVENNLFFIGSNSDPQSGPSYILAGDCSLPSPTNVADIGFPDMHIVINAIGNAPQGVIFADGFELAANAARR